MANAHFVRGPTPAGEDNERHEAVTGEHPRQTQAKREVADENEAAAVMAAKSISGQEAHPLRPAEVPLLGAHETGAVATFAPVMGWGREDEKDDREILDDPEAHGAEAGWRRFSVWRDGVPVFEARRVEVRAGGERDNDLHSNVQQAATGAAVAVAPVVQQRVEDEEDEREVLDEPEIYGAEAVWTRVTAWQHDVFEAMHAPVSEDDIMNGGLLFGIQQMATDFFPANWKLGRTGRMRLLEAYQVIEHAVQILRNDCENARRAEVEAERREDEQDGEHAVIMIDDSDDDEPGNGEATASVAAPAHASEVKGKGKAKATGSVDNSATRYDLPS